MEEINLQLVGQWFEELRNILEKANGICSGANEKAQKTVGEVNEILNENQYQFLENSISQQLRLLDIIRNSLHQMGQSFEKEFEEEMSLKAQDQLDDSLIRLSSIKTTGGRSLKSFVNEEEISLTRSLFIELKDEIVRDKLKLNVSELSTQLKQFQDEFSQILDEDSEKLITTDLQAIITKNNELEQDMAALLEGLTKHYDQTKKAADFFKDTQVSSMMKIELYRVLQTDSRELPDVMDELQSYNEEFLANCEVVEKNLVKFKKNEELLIRFSQDLLKSGTKLENEFILEFNKNYTKLLQNFISISGLNDNLIELSKYYQNFVKSFQSLQAELQRRSTLNEKIEKMISEFERKFDRIRAEDQELRGKFLSANGEYLPSNILDNDNNLLYNPLPKLTIGFNSEQIPKI